MNQDEGAGHSAITRQAVHQMFQDALEQRGETTIDGLTEEEYASRLDAAQEYQDRPTDFRRGAPLGPTVRPSSWDPDVQRQHAMSDPSMSGDENLRVDRQYIVDQLDGAHDSQGNLDQEFAHLGAAVHATEDSYSEAHMWRGDAVHSGDPTAPIQSINNFDWTDLTAAGSGDGAVLLEGTHDARFDYAPVRDGEEVLGTDRAAVRATADILERYEASRQLNAHDADAAMSSAVDPYFQGADGGVAVNRTADAAFLAEDERRWEIERQQLQAAGIDHLDYSGMDVALHRGAQVVEGVESGVHAVEQAASSAYHATAHAVSHAATVVEDTAVEAYHEASQAASAVEDAAVEAYHATSDAVSHAASAVEDTASAAVDRVESWFSD